MKIVTVVGARPQFIKAGAVSRSIAAHNAESSAQSERIEAAMSNPKSEGFERFACTCVQTGDVMLDAALYYSIIYASKSELIQDLGLQSEPFALCTVHRAENTDDPERISSIVRALNKIAEKIRVIMPLHPRTRRLLGEQWEKLQFEPIDPVSYFDMLELLKRTEVVLTDSGGLQKEAYFFKKPCITLRDETEWVELVTGGYNRLAGIERHSIVEPFSQSVVGGIPTETELYGAGKSSGAIIQALRSQM